MVFVRADETARVQMFQGVTRKLISSGERATLVRIELGRGSLVPPHSHPHEQIGFVASGKLHFTVAGESMLLTEGDGYAIPSNAIHSVEAHEDSVAIDVFSPVREEYL